MRDLSTLQHVCRTTATGAEILVLDTGAILSPEDVAMIQALNSRNPRGVRGHLKALAEGKNSGSFMDQYYVGYGDKSIGDYATTTIFIEKVAMPVAKAIQDWSLYDGQEGSTRFFDFSEQPFLNPYGTREGEAIQENWRRFYLKALPILVEDLKQRYPRQEGEDEKLYEKAIRARAFDIARGFLPAGATTNLSWHTNLRQAADHLMRLRHHPLDEVRLVAEAIEEALREAHPHSFNQRRYPATEEYNDRWMKSDYFYSPRNHPDFEASDEFFNFDRLTNKMRQELANRPPKTEIPREFGDCGTIDFSFTLDYASFRDIQRHRAVYQRMPVLSADYGFGEWYLSEMPENLRHEAGELLEKQQSAIYCLEPSNVLFHQYYQPMGYNVPCVVSGDLPSIVWLVELRATRFVHPTLRKRACQMAIFLEDSLGRCGLKLHLDQDPDRFDVKRGQHDIVEKV
jgi:thymidylate synthase ThyX